MIAQITLTSNYLFYENIYKLILSIFVCLYYWTVCDKKQVLFCKKPNKWQRIVFLLCSLYGFNKTYTFHILRCLLCLSLPGKFKLLKDKTVNKTEHIQIMTHVKCISSINLLMFAVTAEWFHVRTLILNPW